MEPTADANDVLQNLQNQLEFLEEKANYAKQLMEQAALLSVIKFDTSETDKYQNEVEVLHTDQVEEQAQIEETQKQVAEAEQAELELLQQREQLLYALIGCIGDLENLYSTFEAVENHQEVPQHSVKNLNSEILKQAFLINALKEKTEASGSKDPELAQKIQSAQDVLSQLNTEKATFEQTLAGLGALLQEQLKLRNDINNPTTPLETDDVKKDFGAEKEETISEHNTMVPRTLEQHDAENVESESSNSSDEQHIVSKLQRHIMDLQSTIEQLEGAIDVNRQPSSTSQ